MISYLRFHPIFLILLLALSGCGYMTGRSLSKSKSTILKAEKSVTVASQSQTLVSYARCLGLSDDQIRSETISAYREGKALLSATGGASTITAPMMMSVVSIAAEVCLDAINVEKSRADRFFFRGYNLGGTNTQPYNFEYTLQSLATSCWSRSATADEIAVLKKALEDVSLFEKKNQSEALFLCTNILASGEGVRR